MEIFRHEGQRLKAVSDGFEYSSLVPAWSGLQWIKCFFMCKSFFKTTKQNNSMP